MSALVIRPIRVAADGSEEGGVLVLADGLLVAVLSNLQDPIHENDRGRWFLEAGFGHCAARQDTFGTLEDALRWVAKRLGLDADAAVTPALSSYEASSEPPDGLSSGI